MHARMYSWTRGWSMMASGVEAGEFLFFFLHVNHVNMSTCNITYPPSPPYLLFLVSPLGKQFRSPPSSSFHFSHSCCRCCQCVCPFVQGTDPSTSCFFLRLLFLHIHTHTHGPTSNIVHARMHAQKYTMHPNLCHAILTPHSLSRTHFGVAKGAKQTKPCKTLTGGLIETVRSFHQHCASTTERQQLCPL